MILEPYVCNSLTRHTRLIDEGRWGVDGDSYLFIIKQDLQNTAQKILH